MKRGLVITDLMNDKGTYKIEKIRKGYCSIGINHLRCQTIVFKPIIMYIIQLKNVY